MSLKSNKNCNLHSFLMNHMRLLIIHIIQIFNLITSSGQTMMNIPYDYHKDSSYYSIVQTQADSWWIAGESGVLKEVNRNGTTSNLAINLNGNDVFKMEANEQNVYIVGQGPSLYIIDKQTHKCKYFIFKDKLKNACFYDLVVLPNNQIILCGGNHKIAHAKKTIPNGFIALLNPENEKEEIQIMKKTPFQFYFAITQSKKDSILYASSFNGYHSTIYKSKNGIKWERYKSIKGIIHDLMLDQNENLWFSGTNGMNYHKHGLIGYVKNKNIEKTTTNSGCIWRIIEQNNNIVAVNVKGDLLIFDKNTLNYQIEKTGFEKPIYCIGINNYQEILIGGHGKSIKIKLPKNNEKRNVHLSKN